MSHDVLVGALGAGDSNVVALPASGVIIPDQRGDGRWLRVTWHEEAGVVVLSMWRETGCVATVRVDRDQVPALVTALVDGLASS